MILQPQDYERRPGKFSLQNFQPPGPVGAAFIESQGKFDFIRGPWGSGKTIAAVFKCIRHAGVDACVVRDSNPKYPHGVVHVRIAAIRDTYREMAKTALASWHEFFPKNGPFTRNIKQAYTGGSDRPVLHKLEWKVIRTVPGPRGTWQQVELPVLLDMEFGAIGSANLDSFFKGYEITFGWLNECDLLAAEVPARMYGRTARYPPMADIQPWEAERLGIEVDPNTGSEAIKVPRIVMGDFNPPDESNWTYEREIEEPEKWPDYNFFAQPSGLSPQGENRIGKPHSRYVEEESAFGGPTNADSLRNVHGQYAARADAGTPVYAGHFNINKHKSDVPLAPREGLPILLGFDAGGSPTCGIAQMLPTGQALCLREIVSPPGQVTSVARFCENVNEVLLRDFANVPVVGAWIDPSAFYGADKNDAADLSFAHLASLALGINIMPTLSNDIRPRIEAVMMQLRDIDTNTPGLICDPRLKYTIRGFVSKYHLTKAATAGKTDDLKPDKGDYSHIHDAWQYLFLGYRGGGLAKSTGELVRGRNVIPITTNKHHHKRDNGFNWNV